MYCLSSSLFFNSLQGRSLADLVFSSSGETTYVEETTVKSFYPQTGSAVAMIIYTEQ